MMWQKGTPSIMQLIQRAANADTWLHPFVDGIKESQLLPGWKTLTIDHYNGLSNLDEHVDAFVTQMSMLMNDNAIMCRVFPTNLKGATLHWYTHLLRNSTDSFATIKMCFKVQYAIRIPHHLIAMELANIQQDEYESLRDFMERFSSISVKIWDLSLEVSLTLMIMALKYGTFSDNLCKKLPTTLEELRARTARFIQMEEMTRFKEKVCG